MLYMNGKQVPEVQARKASEAQLAVMREVYEVNHKADAPKGFFSIEARAKLK